MKEVCTNAPFRFDMHYKKETGFITIRWDPSFLFVFVSFILFLIEKHIIKHL